MKTRLYDVAKVLRSKNSGPFELTLDCLFDDETIYRKVKDSGIINKSLVSQLYHVPESMIVEIVFFDPALGFKITLARKVSSGTTGDTDVYGAQQHAPLMELMIEL